MKKLLKRMTVAAILTTSLLLGGCDNVSMYGSVGYSSFNGYNGFGTSVSVGGRIF